jgi:hypothetical protein
VRILEVMLTAEFRRCCEDTGGDDVRGVGCVRDTGGDGDVRGVGRAKEITSSVRCLL